MKLIEKDIYDKNIDLKEKLEQTNTQLNSLLGIKNLLTVEINNNEHLEKNDLKNE